MNEDILNTKQNIPTPESFPQENLGQTANTNTPISSSPTDSQTPPTTTTAPSTSQTTSPDNEHKNNNGLVLVAVVLAILIVVLGTLYYVILTQSSKSNEPTSIVPQPTKTSVPSITPTATPTDEEMLNSEISDTTTDETELNQITSGL